MVQGPKKKAKKQVSPVTAVVIIVVVLALIVGAYMRFGNSNKGLDENDPNMKKIRSEMAAVEKKYGPGYIMSRRQAMRAARMGQRGGSAGGSMRGRPNRRGTAPTTPVAP
jgi:hypothetical protein